jgi:nitrite reductase/ring-hydroxylating ferredoxin subunit
MATSSSLRWFDLPNAPSVGTELGILTDIPDGGAKIASLELKSDTNNLNPFKFIMLRSGQNVVAYVNRCAHFGVPLSENDEHLILESHISISCNVHYARFRWQDGYCIRGDCEGESLIAIPITIEAGGRIVISS